MSVSMHLAKQGIPHRIMDSAQFPRDKVCGDAVSGKVTSILQQLNVNFDGMMNSQKDTFQPCKGISFVSPDGNRLDLPFNKPKDKAFAGYVSTRMDFDHFLFQQMDSEWANFSNEQVLSVELLECGVLVNTDKGTYRPDVFIDSSGAHSRLAKATWNKRLDPKHHSAGLRLYFEGVAFPDNHLIELHFFKDVLPGYFWIFPLPNGKANVGIGMLTKEVSERKVNLKALMEKIIRTNPQIKERFKNAVQLDSVSGWGLPMGSTKRQIAGNGYAMIGDAAGLIDPFTGEGIGNAMISGKIIAEEVGKFLEQLMLDRSAYGLLANQYQQRVYELLGAELKISHLLQKMLKYPWLFNVIARKANRSHEVKQLLINMFEDLDLRAELKKPSFYGKVLFG